MFENFTATDRWTKKPVHCVYQAMIVAIAAIAAAVVWRNHKWLYALAALMLVGVASAQSVTPVLAAAAGLFALATTGGSRRLRVAVIVAGLALVFLAAAHPGSRQRFQRLFAAASSGRLPEITSFRVVPAAAGHAMIEYSNRALSGLVVAVAALTWIVSRGLVGAPRGLRRWSAAIPRWSSTRRSACSRRPRAGGSR